MHTHDYFYKYFNSTIQNKHIELYIYCVIITWIFFFYIVLNGEALTKLNCWLRYYSVLYYCSSSMHALLSLFFFISWISNFFIMNSMLLVTYKVFSFWLSIQMIYTLFQIKIYFILFIRVIEKSKLLENERWDLNFVALCNLMIVNDRLKFKSRLSFSW